jgi:Fuc2NAc and GlcNAc transferase
MVSIIGFLDDLVKLTIKFRLLVQLLVSIVAAVAIIPIDNYLNILNIFLLSGASIFLVWSTNLFNFMDGIDGLAGVEAVFVLSIGGGLLFIIANEPIFSGLLWAISCITLGFLWFNLPPAKIFMGDVGSYFFGFLIAVSALISHFIFNVSIVFWLIIYLAFLFDATITLVRRFLAGEKWYLSHRSHAYQRLQNIGWQHRDILYGLAAVNCWLLILAIFGYYNGFIWSGIFALAGLTIIYLLIEFKIKIYEKNT